MKKLLPVALLCAVAVAFTAGCSKSSSGADTFTVGFDAEFPPYGYKDGDTYKGFDLDLAREVCARKGWTFVARPIDWDAKDMELKSGSIDCIWNGFTIQGREDSYEWTPAYVDNSQVVIVKVDSPIAKLADLAGKKVAVQTDTPVQKALQNEDGDKVELGKTFGSIIVVPSYNNAIMELEAGAVDAIALDIGVAKQKMADKADKFKMLDEIIMTETYGIGFKKGNVALKNEVEASLKEIFADGTGAKIAEAYGIEPAALLLK